MSGSPRWDGVRPLTAAQFADICGIPGLYSLEIDEQPELADDWLDPLRSHPTLENFSAGRERSIYFGFMAPASGTALTAAGCAILATVPNLSSVSLPGSPIGDDGLHALAKSSELAWMDVTACGVTDAGLAAFAGREGLRGAKLAGNAITDAGFVALELNDVWRLDLSDTECGDESLAFLRGRWRDSVPGRIAPPGVEVDLSGSRVTDAGLRHLAAAPRIGRLALARTAVTGDGFDADLRFGGRFGTRIELTGSALTDRGCARLADNVILGRNLNLTCGDTTITSDGVARLATMSKLTELSIGGPNVTDAAVAPLAEAPALRRLRVQGSPLTGTAFADFQDFVQIRSLTLASCEITDDGVAAIADMPDLERLWIAGGRVTDGCLSDLKYCDTLTSLQLQDVPVGSAKLGELADFRPGPTNRQGKLRLTLNGVGLTDAILAGLPPLPHVRSVQFRNDPIGLGAVLDFIGDQPQLESVSVQSCPAATGDGPARIAAALAGR